MSDTLTMAKRVKLGSHECRKLRRDGRVPGNIYGHGKDALPVATDGDTLLNTIMAGHHVVDVDIEGTVEKAMFQDVQWDTFGRQIEHFDLIWVDADERVNAEVPIELVGNAPGAIAGGVLDQVLYTVELECLAIEIPDKIEVKVVKLQIGDSITADKLELPPSAKIELPDDAVVVQVTEAVEVPEEDGEGLDAGPAEPEVIGRAGDEDEESDEG